LIVSSSSEITYHSVSKCTTDGFLLRVPFGKDIIIKSDGNNQRRTSFACLTPQGLIQFVHHPRPNQRVSGADYQDAVVFVDVTTHDLVKLHPWPCVLGKNKGLHTPRPESSMQPERELLVRAPVRDKGRIVIWVSAIFSRPVQKAGNSFEWHACSHEKGRRNSASGPEESVQPDSTWPVMYYSVQPPNTLSSTLRKTVSNIVAPLRSAPWRFAP